LRQAQPSARDHIMYPPRNYPTHHPSIPSAFPRSTMHSSEPPRDGVGRYTDDMVSGRPSHFQHELYHGRPNSPSMPTVRSAGEYAEPARLPGIGSVRHSP
jgi:hypothetical protein